MVTIARASDETFETETASYIESKGLDLPVLFDRERKLAKAYLVRSTPTLVLVDAETPGNLKVLGAVVEPVALKGVSGVVVKGTLAFVAASGVARVVSIDVRSEAKPSVLSFVKLSAASTVALHGGGLYKC